MVKKRLTDLLREEVEKSPEPNGEKGEATSHEQHLEQDTDSVEKPTMNTRSQSSARRSTQTKAELEATVTELRAALEEAQQQDTTLTQLEDALEDANKKEASLQQQIIALQADLQQQQKSVDKLQKQVETIDQLKTEFEQAKKAALQLAQANEKLTQEINALKKENEALKVDGKRSLEPHLGRPIQKDSEKPADFAKNTWLL